MNNGDEHSENSIFIQFVQCPPFEFTFPILKQNKLFLMQFNMPVEISRECFSWPEISDYEEETINEEKKTIQKEKIAILTIFVNHETISEEILKMINLEIHSDEEEKMINSTHQVTKILFFSVFCF